MYGDDRWLTAVLPFPPMDKNELDTPMVHPKTGRFMGLRTSTPAKRYRQAVINIVAGALPDRPWFDIKRRRGWTWHAIWFCGDESWDSDHGSEFLKDCLVASGLAGTDVQCYADHAGRIRTEPQQVWVFASEGEHEWPQTLFQ